MNAAKSVQALHERCAVYTTAPTAAKLLDYAGWTVEADLSRATLLEPCVGDGAILIEAIDRLLASFARQARPISHNDLAERIVSFEIHPQTVTNTRSAVQRRLRENGMPIAAAKLLSHRWVREADFLLSAIGRATHVVANPPYVRWSKLPPLLAASYRNSIRSVATRGDLAVAFIDKMLEWAGAEGSVIALVSDRWMFAQYGEAFIQDLVARGWKLDVLEERPAAPFVRDVAAYSAIVGFQKRAGPAVGFRGRDASRRQHELLIERYGSLLDAGCVVRVGPALGCGHTYILSRQQAAQIEPELLRPYIGRECLDGEVTRPSNLLVACPYDERGTPICLEEWPGFARWAEEHKTQLSKRSCVAGRAAWWRTIDAIGPQWSGGQKLLVPELCQEPRATLDESNAIPAHSIYAIWSSVWPVAALQRVLNSGLMRLTAEAYAPQLKHGWFRFYRRFLVQTPLPRWADLSEAQRLALNNGDSREFARCFHELFAFEPDRRI